MRSSYDGCVSVVSFRPPLVVRTSSPLERSLPQPPQMSSLPVPPTDQSFPRSPKSRSLPSVFTLSISRQLPFEAKETQPGGVSRPSVAERLRKYWLAGARPVFQGVPFGLNRIARRASYSS